jgi:hypothetical protein
VKTRTATEMRASIWARVFHLARIIEDFDACFKGARVFDLDGEDVTESDQLEPTLRPRFHGLLQVATDDLAWSEA